mgnify:CR=1 FL=1
MMRRFVKSVSASLLGDTRRERAESRAVSLIPRRLRGALLAGLAGLAALTALHTEAEAQEIQLTGPLAGAPAVRKLRLHRAGRFELAPGVSFSLLDQYQRTIMPGATASYHFTDWIGVSLFGLRETLARIPAAGALGFAQGVELLRRHVAGIGGAGSEHLPDDFLVPVHALHLVERAFVPIEIEPAHAVEDGLHGFGRGAGHVGILDAQDEIAAVTPGIGPREQRRARPPDVQIAGGAGGEAGADGRGHDENPGKRETRHFTQSGANRPTGKFRYRYPRRRRCDRSAAIRRCAPPKPRYRAPAAPACARRTGDRCWPATNRESA